ncbi:hypothetical protein AALC17_03715 [Oscillospiraceae bacterium 38-13]
MGLLLGFGLMGVFAGSALAVVCFSEARQLLRRGCRLPAGGFAAGAVLCAAGALGGAWLAWNVVGFRF